MEEFAGSTQTAMNLTDAHGTKECARIIERTYFDSENGQFQKVLIYVKFTEQNNLFTPFFVKFNILCPVISAQQNNGIYK